MPFKPSYLNLFQSGELKRRAQKAVDYLSCCTLCANRCRVDRNQGFSMSVCLTGRRARVSSWGAHHGEERPLSGWHGSGTIFFTHCNLHCVYCQNWDISQKRLGEEISAEALAGHMLQLQNQGCHNINFVSPSHVIAQILEATCLAVQEGMHLPLVYNTGGYDSLEGLQLLEGIIDIYMPDMKYSNPAAGLEYSKVKNYPSVNRQAVREMHRQTGDLCLDKNGLAMRGLLVRHLVLPNQLAGTREILEFLAREISIDTYINIMDQYHPCYRADEYPLLDRPPSRQEYQEALQIAREFGLHRLD
jgi:putative pyruvate formate lyase activating enzyme